MFSSILGLAGGVGGGGTSANPGSGGGYDLSTSSTAATGPVTIEPTTSVRGGGTSLGPVISLSPVYAAERVTSSGSDYINKPLASMFDTSAGGGGMLAVVALFGLLIVYLATRK